LSLPSVTKICIRLVTVGLRSFSFWSWIRNLTIWHQIHCYIAFCAAIALNKNLCCRSWSTCLAS
jgi:hypothetical protein